MKGATMPAENGLSESLENYLETILYLEQSQKVARAKDIADRLNVQRGSVTGALKNLSEKGYINYEPYSFITLTSKGMKLAKEISYRHAALKEFLLKVLRIDPVTAEETACRMEHAIDKKTFERLVCFIDYVFTCPRAGEEWIQSFANYCASGGRKQAECDLCIQSIQTGK
jgi:DtxR family transcriptional regulator, Mn-dependent transcriptional regulator